MAKLQIHNDASSRTIRQIKAVDRLEYKNWIGTIVAYTGFGKTRGLALRAIERIKPKSIIITVPSLTLKDDWEELLEKSEYNYRVIVVNTLIKSTYDCDLLIVDEVHRFAAKTFIKTFKVKYTKLLCLTATLERNDDRHLLLTEIAPVVDNITLQEGLKNKWVKPFNVIKVPIKLTNEEEALHKDIVERYKIKAGELPGKNPLKSAEYWCWKRN